MLRQIFIIISLCLVSKAAFAANEASLEENKKSFSESPLNFGLDLQYYTPAYKKYSYTNDVFGNTVTSSDSNKAIHIAFEWLPVGRWFGKMGVGLSTGFSMLDGGLAATFTKVTDSQGNPKFGSDGSPLYSVQNSTVSLFAVPSSLFLSYHMDYLYNQIVVPYAKIGPSATLFRQSFNSGPGTYQMAYGLDYSLGAELCLNTFEPRTGRQFDSRFGVNGTFLTFDYTKSNLLATANTNDLSYDAFRFGMRFEF